MVTNGCQGVLNALLMAPEINVDHTVQLPVAGHCWSCHLTHMYLCAPSCGGALRCCVCHTKVVHVTASQTRCLAGQCLAGHSVPDRDEELHAVCIDHVMMTNFHELGYILGRLAVQPHFLLLSALSNFERPASKSCNRTCVLSSAERQYFL